jgi:hypothetical protein
MAKTPGQGLKPFLGLSKALFKALFKAGRQKESIEKAAPKVSQLTSSPCLPSSPILKPCVSACTKDQKYSPVELFVYFGKKHPFGRENTVTYKEGLKRHYKAV